MPLCFVFVSCVLGINPEVMTSVVAMPLTSAIGTDNILALGFNPRIKDNSQCNTSPIHSIPESL